MVWTNVAQVEAPATDLSSLLDGLDKCSSSALAAVSWMVWTNVAQVEAPAADLSSLLDGLDKCSSSRGSSYRLVKSPGWSGQM